MNSMWQAIIASVIGGLFTVLARYVDRILPDPENRHPMPPPPGVPVDR